MRVLVVAASKHGGTWEIAEEIARTLDAAGAEPVRYRLEPHRDGPEPGAFDAVVAGSGVYAGRWLPAARHWLDDHQQGLRRRPVWLFSSGPVGIVPRPPEDEAVRAEPLLEQTGAREHRLFGGRLDRRRLGFAERALVGALGVNDGDHRDFAAVSAWARSIAAGLGVAPDASTVTATVHP